MTFKDGRFLQATEINMVTNDTINGNFYKRHQDLLTIME